MSSLSRPVVLVPAAGSGQRFKEVGIVTPKPFIRLCYRRGEPLTMLEHALHGTRGLTKFVAISGETQRALFVDDVTVEFPECRFLVVQSTRGQADTVRQLAEHAPEDRPILVLNSDVRFDYSFHTFQQECHKHDAGVLVVRSRDPGLSYVDGAPTFLKAVEKEAITDLAIAGAFYFRDRRVLLDALKAMDVAGEVGPNGESYLSLALNHVPGYKRSRLMPNACWTNMGTPLDIWNNPHLTYDAPPPLESTPCT